MKCFSTCDINVTYGRIIVQLQYDVSNKQHVDTNSYYATLAAVDVKARDILTFDIAPPHLVEEKEASNASLFYMASLNE